MFSTDAMHRAVVASLTKYSLKKDYGIIVKEAYSVAGTRGNDRMPVKFDFYSLVEGLRASVKDISDDLSAPGETAEETERLVKSREILENVLKGQEERLISEMNWELSGYWGSGQDTSPTTPRISLPVGYELPKSQTDLYLMTPIRQKIREDLNENLPKELSDISFFLDLTRLISSYREHFMTRFNKILRELRDNKVPRELFANEDDIQKMVSSVYSRPYWEQSVYKLAPFDTLSLMTAQVFSRPSKLEIMTEVCLELYTTKSNQMLFVIDTKPKLKDNYYIQTILPEFIAVGDSETKFDMISTINEGHEKNLLIGGLFCGKLYLLPKDCNLKETRGCAHVITPKEKFDANNLSDRTVKIARKNGKTQKDSYPKIDF